MSRLQRRKLAAIRRNVWVLRWPGEPGWYVFGAGYYVPDGPLTRRQAINLAYAASLAKHHKLEVTFE